MSNRLIQIGRLPLIPDPYAALKASAILSETVELTNNAIAYKDVFFAPSTLLLEALRRYNALLDRATYLRDLWVLDDETLESRGIKRDRIPELFFQRPANDFKYRPRSVHAGDGER